MCLYGDIGKRGVHSLSGFGASAIVNKIDPINVLHAAMEALKRGADIRVEVSGGVSMLRLGLAT